MISYRHHAIAIINQFYDTSLNLKTLQNEYFKKYNIKLDDRNRVIVLTREILRWKGRLDWYIEKHLNTPFNKLQTQLLSILEMGTYELMFDEKVPDYASINSAVEITKRQINKKAGGLVNAILRKISVDSFTDKPEEIEDYQWYSFPQWLFNKWTKQFGIEGTIRLANYFNNPANLNIRRNDGKIAKNDFENNLLSDVKMKAFDNSDRFYVVKKGGSLLKRHDSFKRGEFSFQDRASGMVVEVLDPRPGEIILDVCAAPGTKSNYISELMKNTGTIYACDIAKDRIELAENDSKRLGNGNIIFAQKDATKSEFPIADRVLIDAPCTGTGTIGRRPDIKWRRTPEQLKNITQLQTSILNNVHRFVKPGGVLVYATCSIEHEENWEVVDAFLKFHNDFKVVSVGNQQPEKYTDEKGALNIYPPEHKMDGMFAVKMMKDA